MWEGGTLSSALSIYPPHHRSAAYVPASILWLSVHSPPIYLLTSFIFFFSFSLLIDLVSV